MSSLSPNPLAKHFRQPALYVKLPSQGRWYPEGAIELTATGEIPIYPMTARDEITMKTPDALMNGSSTVHVLQSCCPSIRDPWKMPLVDLDTLLIAVRMASYTKTMEFTCVCPHCKTTNEHALDLEVILNKIQLANWDIPIEVDGLSIQLRPQNYEEYNKNNLVNFEEQRIMQVVRDQEMSDEEKSKQFDVLFQRLIETGLGQISRSVESITMSDGTVVSNNQFISEFLNNCDRRIWEAIKTELDNIKNQNNYTDVNIICSNDECTKPFVTPFVFEQTNFFG
jgi:hypothetical protein